MEASNFVTRDAFWQLQVQVNELSATQGQQAERIMRLEEARNGGRSRSLWGAASPFPSALTSSIEPAPSAVAEAFRTFEADAPNSLITSLTLETTDEARRAASRANSVRFDESANHYAPSRQSIDLPTRTGSGLGTHPLSERSSSHRSDGRNSTAGFGRANSFGLENSRLLGSIHNSPRLSGHPPPGLFALGPCPAIIRCWMTETFTNDSLLYAAVCTGSAVSSIALALLQNMGVERSIFEENGLKKIRQLVYLTEAKIVTANSRSTSPSPTVPSINVKFVVDDQQVQDKTIQIVIGSDVLRAQSADVLLSQDKMMIFDDDRSQLSIPLVRPEDDGVYRYLLTKARSRSGSMSSQVLPSDLVGDTSAPGIIGRPGRISSVTSASSPGIDALTMSSTAVSDTPSKADIPREILSRPINDLGVRAGDDSKSATDSERSITAASSVKGSNNVWAGSWRTSATQPSKDINGSQTSATYLRHNAPRPMKVLRPTTKPAPNTVRTVSNSATSIVNDGGTRSSEMNGTEVQNPTPTRTNPIGSGTAFGWLNSRGKPPSGNGL